MANQQRQHPMTRVTAAGAARRPAGSLRRGIARIALLLTVLTLLPGVAAAAPGWMRNAQEPLEPSSLVNNPPGISLEQAANKVRRETGGRVLSASPTERSGQRGFEVRVLLDGKRVKSYFVDGEGRIRAPD
jgi:hypothetical protein